MVSRVSSLTEDIEQALSHQPHASPSYVKQRRYILLALIEDLRAINRVIPKLSSLNKNIIKQLIQYWQTQDNERNTIYHKITILRTVCKHYLINNPIPSNQELGVMYHLAGKTISFDSIPMLDIENLSINYLYRLQRYFGLKVIEALKVESYMFDKAGLWLARAAAYNSKNRFIPYWCEEQKQLANDLLLDANIAIANKKLLNEQYKIILQQAGIDDKEHYRYQYIYHRYEYLLSAGSIDYQSILKQLRSETGYRENKQIKVILKCLNGF